MTNSSEYTRLDPIDTDADSDSDPDGCQGTGKHNLPYTIA